MYLYSNCALDFSHIQTLAPRVFYAFTTLAHQKFYSLALWSFGGQTDRLGLPIVVMTKGCKVQSKLMEYLMHPFYTRMKQSCLRNDSM